MRILLVEDNELSREMLSRRLLRSGFDVLTAVNGEESIRIARSQSPDVILMDLSLPVMDGWMATREIKKDIGTSHIPVIALTAHAFSGDRDSALAAGCDDFDTKPINFKRLLSKINIFQKL